MRTARIAGQGTLSGFSRRDGLACRSGATVFAWEPRRRIAGFLQRARGAALVCPCVPGCARRLPETPGAPPALRRALRVPGHPWRTRLHLSKSARLPRPKMPNYPRSSGERACGPGLRSPRKPGKARARGRSQVARRRPRPHRAGDAPVRPAVYYSMLCCIVLDCTVLYSIVIYRYILL